MAETFEKKAIVKNILWGMFTEWKRAFRTANRSLTPRRIENLTCGLHARGVFLVNGCMFFVMCI